MNLYTSEVVDVDMDVYMDVDVDMVEAFFKDMVEAEAEAEDGVTIPIHYLVHVVMELLFLKIRYSVKVNINHCPKFNKLQFNNSKVRLVGSMDIPRLMDMF